jgi:hypothetical protein
VVEGEIRLHLRLSEAGSYAAGLDSAGAITLYRDDEILAEAALPEDAPTDGWHALRLSAIDNTLRVSVDSQEVIAQLDPAETALPTGGVAFGPGPAGVTADVDDFALWIEED